MKNMLIIILSLVVLAGGGLFAYQSFFASDDAKAQEISVESLIEARVTMEPITTHLASPSSYIIIAFDVQTSSLEAKEEFELRIAEMKSATITTFNATEVKNIRGEDGTKILLETMTAKFNEIMTTGEVSDVFITDFKLQ